MKNILTMAAPASHGTCVHDTEHLLKETHSPTHTVNFCKYYKGKNLFLTVTRLLANFFKVTLDWFAVFGYIFNEEGKYCIDWLILTCVDNSLTLENYAQKIHYDFSGPNVPLSKIYLISHVTNFTYQDPQISFQRHEFCGSMCLCTIVQYVLKNYAMIHNPYTKKCSFLKS